MINRKSHQQKSNSSEKKMLFTALALFSIFLFVSCEPKKKDIPNEEPPVPAELAELAEPTEVAEPAPEQEPIVEEPKEKESVKEPEVVAEPQPEPVVEEQKKEEPVKEPEPEDEYSRSVGDISISRDTFAEDKEKILKIISELDNVMKNFDYKSWLTYVDQESIDCWSRPANLRKAQNRLPVKGLRLTSLQDYFKYVFVPARKGRQVTEIRYISDTYIKAIEVGKEQDIVYYYFNKINGQWMVNIPPLED